MCGESVISTTGARGASAAANAEALQGHASMGGGAARAGPTPARAHAIAAKAVATPGPFFNGKRRMIENHLKKKPWAAFRPPKAM